MYGVWTLPLQYCTYLYVIARYGIISRVENFSRPAIGYNLLIVNVSPQFFHCYPYRLHLLMLRFLIGPGVYRACVKSPPRELVNVWIKINDANVIITLLRYENSILLLHCYGFRNYNCKYNTIIMCVSTYNNTVTHWSCVLK